MKKVLLEICCGSAEDVIEAYKGGADRVELNSDLFHGGLTPTLGSLLVAKSQTDFPVMTMIRPREGGFCYTSTEFAVAMQDAKLMTSHGADGLVFGFLHPDGTLDAERTRILTDIAKSAGKEAVFHRAIDVMPDWKAALDQLIEIGIDRVLTSGQEPNVLFGTQTVKEMIDYAAGRIQILPGAGITERNLDRVLQETGCTQIHMTGHKSMEDFSTSNNRSIFYGGALYPSESLFQVIDVNSIQNVANAIKNSDDRCK